MEKWFFFSDMQVPHQDKRAVELAFKVMKWFKPTVIVNIGDLADGTGTSRWADGTTEETLAGIVEENEMVRDYWAKLRKFAPDARMIWTLGNHDIRPFEYVDKKAPALREMISYESLWGTGTFDVEVYDYNLPPQVKMGDIYIHHGVAVSKHAGDSARADVENWGVSIVRGHSHRQGYFARTYELKGETVRGYEIGHLMDIGQADYSQVHNWQQGFAVGHEHDGIGSIDLISIQHDYSCMYAGKRFTA